MANHVAGLVENGATLQMGIGNIPNAVLGNLTNHQRLGIHTEMFSDGILPLVELGIITGEKNQNWKNRNLFCHGNSKIVRFYRQ